MDREKAIDNIELKVRQFHSGEASGHDWWHVVRVLSNAWRIAQREGGDHSFIRLCALLHDVGDRKLHGGDEKAGLLLVRRWLQEEGFERDTVEKVLYVCENISFAGGVSKVELSLEGQIVQDADRLDAMGAVGIARTFAYGGAKGRLMYDPDCPPMVYGSAEQYKGSDAPTINHFYEKLLKLKDLMNTDTARAFAQERHDFMLAYLERFFEEIK